MRSHKSPLEGPGQSQRTSYQAHRPQEAPLKLQEQEPHPFLPASCPCCGVGITADGDETPGPTSLGAYLPRLGGGVPDAVETVLGRPLGARGLEEPTTTRRRGGEPASGSSRGPSDPTHLPHSKSTGGHRGRRTEPGVGGGQKGRKT